MSDLDVNVSETDKNRDRNNPFFFLTASYYLTSIFGKVLLLFQKFGNVIADYFYAASI